MGNTAFLLSLILLTDIITASNFIALFVALIVVFFLLGFILGLLMNSKRKETKRRETKRRKPSIEPSIQQLTVDIPDQVYNEKSTSYYTDYNKWPYSAENFIKKNKL